ncbi:MAG: 6-phosphogluconolactonase [Candidatus Dormiibacterota bacterium]
MSGGAGLPGTATVHDDSAAVAVAAADWVLDIAAAAISRGGRLRIALAGGNTPRGLYQLLAAAPRRDATDWSAWKVFFGDERACPADDPSSNYRMAREALLDLVPIPAAQVHRIEGERADLAAAAAEYGTILSSTSPAATPGSPPRLDCILLGLGENGHTASLFPGDPSLEVSDRWAVQSQADYAPYDRITLTFPVLNAAAHVAFLVAGAPKRDALLGVIRGTVPAARVQPVDGELRWFLDTAAAEGL